MSIEIIDQIYQRLVVGPSPSRVISCVPSLTETLIKAGIGKSLAGRTKFCVHPEKIVKEIAVIGGTKNLNLKKIKDINPHLIIANKEENTKTDISTLREDFPVYVSNIRNLEDLLSFLLDMQKIFGSGFYKMAREVQSILSHDNHYQNIPTVAYLIWRRPYMSVGADTFIDYMLTRAGFRNIFNDRVRYPEVTIEDISSNRPDYIFLSSEPYPFKEKHIQELDVLINDSKIIIVDGGMFSWYGSRVMEAHKYFKRLRQSLDLDK